MKIKSGKSKIRISVFLLLLFFPLTISLNCSRKISSEKKSAQEIKGENGSVEKEEMTIKLFFLNGSEFAYEEKTILFDAAKPSGKINNALNELIKGPKGPLMATLPKRTKLLNVFIDEEGIAYVNFSKDIIKNHPGGTFAELATIYSIVRTLEENFKEVSAVQILINGKETDTLAGHIDISRPLKFKGFLETSLNQ